MGRLENKLAVITGGNSGIGLATAKDFIAEGATVVIAGRSQATLDQAVAELGPRGSAVRADVTNSADLDNLFATVKERYGQIDILFVNAGGTSVNPLEAMSEAQFDHIMGVNFKGAYFTVQKALPLMNEGGSIVLNTSVANSMGMPTLSAYAAAKAALQTMIRTISAEVVDRGIRVNAVSPGPIATPFMERTGMSSEQVEGFAGAVLGQVPMKRFGQPEEIAKAVTFLASGDASYVLGVELVVDGGISTL